MANNTEINYGYNKTIKIGNIPAITYLINNGGSNDIVCMNYIYMLKDKSTKNSWNYSCRYKGCGALISLKIGALESGTIGPLVPFAPTYLKINHRGNEVTSIQVKIT